MDPELHKKEISTISILDKPAVVTMQPFTTRLSNINITTSNKKGPCYSASCAFSALGSFMLVPEDTITINSSQSDGRGKVGLLFFMNQKQHRFGYLYKRQLERRFSTIFKFQLQMF